MTGPASSLRPRRPTARRRAGRFRHSISAARSTLFLRSSAAASRARNGSARPALAPPLLALAPPHSPPPLPLCARAALELAPLLPPPPAAVSAVAAPGNMASEGMILTNHDHQIRVGVLTGNGRRRGPRRGSGGFCGSVRAVGVPGAPPPGRLLRRRHRAGS